MYSGFRALWAAFGLLFFFLCLVLLAQPSVSTKVITQHSGPDIHDAISLSLITPPGTALRPIIPCEKQGAHEYVDVLPTQITPRGI